MEGGKDLSVCIIIVSILILLFFLALRLNGRLEGGRERLSNHLFAEFGP